MNQDSPCSGNGAASVRGWPDPVLVSRPDSAFEIEMIPLDDEWRKALTADIEYLKPPRLPRPANLRWWERLAYAWRGL